MADSVILRASVLHSLDCSASAFSTKIPKPCYVSEQSI